MRVKFGSAGVALAALLTVAHPALAQTAPATPPTAPAGQPVPVTAQPGAAAALDPAAEQAPRAGVPAPVEPEFDIAEGIVALVNDDPITSFDLRQRMLLLIAETQVQPTEQNLPAIQRQALQLLVDQRLQWQEVQSFADQVPALTDPEVDQEIALIAQDAGTTPDAYMAYMVSRGIRPETVREQLRVEGSWRRLVGARFNQRAKVSRNQVDQTLRRLSEAQSKPQYLIGEIFIDANRVGGQQEALNGANQLVEQMIQGAPFQAVARQFSSAPSAVSGGDVGWMLYDEAPAAIQPALLNMTAGQLSRPIPTTGGVYIIYMRDKRDGSSTQLASMRQLMVQLPQTASAAEVQAATQRLETVRPGLTCDNILQAAQGAEGLLATDLGEADVSDLAPQFQQVARTGEVGTVSSPIRTPLGVHLLAVCGRRVGGPDAPTFEQVENRLESQQLNMLARRYIRDVRSEALIDVKN